MKSKRRLIKRPRQSLLLQVDLVRVREGPGLQGGMSRIADKIAAEKRAYRLTRRNGGGKLLRDRMNRKWHSNRSLRWVTLPVG